MKKKLKDICTQVRGVSYKPSDLRDEKSGVPILRANNIQDTGIVLDELVYVDSSKVHSEQYLLTDDIVICTSSGSKNLIGKAATFKSSLNASFGAFCKVVRINNSDDLFKAYIQQYFQSKIYRNAISESSAGANINNIKTEDIETLEISLPPKEDQQKIAAELDTIQSAINNKKQQLSLLDEAVKSEFVEMFGNPIANEKNWTKKTMIDVCPIKEYEFLPSENEWILNLDMIESNTGTILEKVISPLAEIGNSTIKFSQNHVLYSKLRPYLNKVALPDSYGFATSELIPFLPGKEINKIYFATFLRSEPFVELINSKSGGAKMPRASMDFLRKFEIPVPPIDLQNDFATFVQQIDKSKFIVKQQIADLQELLDSKMQEYFS